VAADLPWVRGDVGLYAVRGVDEAEQSVSTHPAVGQYPPCGRLVRHQRPHEHPSARRSGHLTRRLLAEPLRNFTEDYYATQ
jgi:hypothetical protein